LIFPWN